MNSTTGVSSFSKERPALLTWKASTHCSVSPQMREANVTVRLPAYKKLLERMSKELAQSRERKIDSTTLATFERWKDLICEMDIILQ